jgi:hypothetical protein
MDALRAAARRGPPSLTPRRLAAAKAARGFVENGVQTPSITKVLRLPAFERCPHEPFAWPRSR